MLAAKIHRATVTHADLDYVGSITIDADLLRTANILPGERVAVVDVTNGARLETYTIAGDAGSGVIGINGAAAHLVKVGDVVIIMAYGVFDPAEVRFFSPSIVHVDAANAIIEVGSDAAAATGDLHRSPHAL